MKHLLLACTWFFYAAPIFIVSSSWRARVLSSPPPSSLSSILLIPQNKFVITLSMLFMGFTAILYEILFFDENTVAPIAGLLVAIFGLLHSAEKSTIHCVFATGAFICILFFSSFVAESHGYLLHFLLVSIAMIIVLSPTSPLFCVLETLFIVVFALIYNIRHFTFTMNTQT